MKETHSARSTSIYPHRQNTRMALDLRVSESPGGQTMCFICATFLDPTLKKISSELTERQANPQMYFVRMKEVLQAWLCVVSLWRLWVSHAVPLDCKDETGSLAPCTSISQEKLLDRVIQHAELIYRVSEDSCTLFEDMFVPYSLHVLRNQAVNTCHSKPFPIPGSKAEIQQISDKWLLHSVLILVRSWMEPLLYLQTTLDRYDDAPDALLKKTKWVYDKLFSLEQGVVVLIRKMLDEGILTPSTTFEHTLSPYDGQFPEMLESVLRDYHLLSCFKKDAHKMETFLKLLKCRQSNNFSCLSQ